MPTHHQITVAPVATEGALGSSDTKTMQEMFPASPLYNGDLTAESVLAMGNDLLISPVVNDGGHTFGTFNRDYSEAPVLADVATGGGGLPGSPYAPAPGSPGPGSMNPSDIPEPPDGFPGDPGTEYGAGSGGLTSPNESSAAIASVTIGDYLFGKSKATA